MYKRSHFSLVIFLSLVACSQSRESWITQPPAEWPPIILTNQFRFNDDHPFFQYAATGFLIDTGKDTLAVTAKHLPWVLNTNNAREQLQQWTLYPSTNRKDSVAVDRLLYDETLIPEGADAHDAWIIGVARPSSRHSYPLKPRFTALQEREKVFIISGTNDHTAIEGKIITRQGKYFTIEHDTKANLSHSGGSPVVDANGYLVGILSYSTSDGQENKPMTFALSIADLAGILSKK